MELRTFGPTDRQVPVIGQGTWYGEDDDRDTAVAALRRGIDLGMTHIDSCVPGPNRNTPENGNEVGVDFKILLHVLGFRIVFFQVIPCHIPALDSTGSRGMLAGNVAYGRDAGVSAASRSVSQQERPWRTEVLIGRSECRKQNVTKF